MICHLLSFRIPSLTINSLTARHLSVLFIGLLLLLPLPAKADTYADAIKMKAQAEREQANGRLDVAQKIFLNAEQLFSQCRGAETEQSLCLYYMCISYFNQRDLNYMQKPMQRLRLLAERHSDNKFIQYDYLSVLAAYESCVYEEKPSEELREKFMTHFKQAVSWQTKMTVSEWKKRQINPMFNLMNIATLYDLSYNPPMIDSMQAYINRALDVDKQAWGDRFDHIEGRISAYDLQAWVLLYQKRYKEAEAKERQVLDMIEEVEKARGNAVLTEKGEAYGFFAELYKAMGIPEKAMEYMALKGENDRKRFDIEKNTAIRNIEARYESQQKDERIAELRRRNIMLTVCVTLLILLLAGITTTVVYRRRLREQKLYEEALAAELEDSARHSSLRLLADQLGITGIDLDEAHHLMSQASKPLTVVDQKYILCFLNGEDVKHIARRFNVEPASVYTVRYRIKKKFPSDVKLPL